MVGQEVQRRALKANVEMPLGTAARRTPSKQRRPSANANSEDVGESRAIAESESFATSRTLSEGFSKLLRAA
jgi:hypothetical protein